MKNQNTEGSLLHRGITEHRGICRKTSARWENANIALESYFAYRSTKNDYHLSLIGLLYVSNFKGGNATINEADNSLNYKLEEYSARLRGIKVEFGEKSLSDLSKEETNSLIRHIKEVVKLLKDNKTEIKGFKTSYLSALLHSFFPRLIPVLDRRLLVNLNLITADQLDSTRQVRNIEEFYPDLIHKVREEAIKTSKSVRELDNYHFIMTLPYWAQAPKNKR